ncbi:MAG: hypothetical protein AMXMBFR45_02940 [Gammaproteobacteria bacterium]|nr:hypothetical protein [Gammaproteobacteria bacterium PRO9]MCZ2080633.1 hypothetical protein [Bryobacterales bacterium]
MTNSQPVGSSSSALRVASWVRGLMYLVCLVPVVFVLWAILRQALMPGGGLLVAVLIGLVVTVAFVWLFRRLYSLCSITVGTEGVAQSFLLQGGNLATRVNVTWDQVQRASFSRHSYYFSAANGLNLELNTALFGDAAATISAVRQLLPPRLLAQIDAGVGAGGNA